MGGRDLPYRPCVGIMVFNRQGLVWVGRRTKNVEGSGKFWQMPQGGIDAGEDPAAAAVRELAEETGMRSVRLVAESAHWYRYDLPDHLVGVAWKGRYRGQKQKWFAARFEGDDSEVDISGIGHKAEFDAWRWADIDELADLIVPFKVDVYRRVVDEFRHLAKS